MHVKILILWCFVPGAGLHGPLRRGPMVEQAVQTVPAEKPGPKKGLASQQQGRDSGRVQRGRGSPQAQRSTTSGSKSSLKIGFNLCYSRLVVPHVIVFIVLGNVHSIQLAPMSSAKVCVRNSLK